LTPNTPRGARPKRTAQEVIDQAIHENRVWEYTCLCLIFLFALVGTGVLIYGVVSSNWYFCLSGSLVGALLWPTLNQAARLWDQNRRIRLLELALNRATTSEEAVSIISRILFDPAAAMMIHMKREEEARDATLRS
jgi:hypothetical protein